MLIKTVVRVFILLLLQISSIQNTFAQKYENSISGYIIDNVSAEPIELVNVYIANTTFGSSTDANGYYIIKSIPPNIHELIVSAVGYSTVEQQIVIHKNSNIKHNFSLRPIIYEGSTIDITAKSPDQWLKNLKKFKDIFFGQSFRAEYCELENPEVLDFVDSTHIFRASIQNPLIITNKILGFKIYCNSLDFQFNSIRNLWSWKIKPHFEDLSGNDTTQNNRWITNRKIAYFGSMYHFLMSLKQNRISQDDYNVYTTEESINRLDPRQNIVFKANIDSLIKPNINIDYHTITSDKIILIKNYSIEDHIKNEYNFDLEFGDTYMESWLFLKYGEMTLDKYGYPVEDNAFVVHGYWATLGVADLLPKYYQFDLLIN